MLNVGENMGHKEDLCPCCFLEKDTQSQILECPVIGIYSDFNEDQEQTEIRYKDIF